MVLAHPELIELEPIEPRGQFQVTLELQRRMFTEWGMWGQKRTETKSLTHIFLHS